ncbi:MFS transporter [Sporosalibacterium faouarense]|uniref:MFS transporter n=1 Tax=Sporosalibacterium faouarense TaxID=516123 RepID=UPI00141D0578|nr:MFS transporter [Sporosalibacterium faouarense]MTI47530.1 MFS transporter [Bacillota bacterium]
MNYTNKLEQNVWKNYIYVFLSNIDLTNGTWMMFLAVKGMSLFQLGMLEGIFHVISFLMEVPTGVVADIWGRKVSRLCGRICSIIFVAILLFSNSFIMFAISFVFAALSYNLESGAGTALVYDSLKELNQEEKFMRINGYWEVTMQFGRVFGLLLGGYLATIDYKYAYGTAAILGIIAAFQTLSFTEPNIDFEFKGEKNVFKVMKSQVTGSINVLRNNKKIGFLIVFSQIIFVFGTTIFYYLQNYLKGNGYTESKIGVLLAISAFIGAIVASQTYKIEKVIKERGILLIMPIISVICIWGIALTKYHFVFFVIMMSIDGMIYVAISDYINKLIPSNKRATIISFASMVFSFFMILVFPIVGKVGDLFNLKVAFKLLGTIALSFLFVNIWVILKASKESKV